MIIIQKCRYRIKSKLVIFHYLLSTIYYRLDILSRMKLSTTIFIAFQCDLRQICPISGARLACVIARATEIRSVRRINGDELLRRADRH